MSTYLDPSLLVTLYPIVLVVVGGAVVWLVFLIDIVLRPFPRKSDKGFWFTVVLLGGVIGALIYYFFVRRSGKSGLPKHLVRVPVTVYLIGLTLMWLVLVALLLSPVFFSFKKQALLSGFNENVEHYGGATVIEELVVHDEIVPVPLLYRGVYKLDPQIPSEMVHNFYRRTLTEKGWEFGARDLPLSPPYFTKGGRKIKVWTSCVNESWSTGEREGETCAFFQKEEPGVYLELRIRYE